MKNASISWLGLRPQEAWAEQIPPPYARADDHPHRAQNQKPARVGDPGSRRAVALRAFGMTPRQVVAEPLSVLSPY